MARISPWKLFNFLNRVTRNSIPTSILIFRDEMQKLPILSWGIPGKRPRVEAQSALMRQEG